VWDERDPWPTDREPVTKHTPRVVIVVIFAAVLIGTSVACCAALSQLFTLVGLEAPEFL
jgi:hypothetical protein